MFSKQHRHHGCITLIYLLGKFHHRLHISCGNDENEHDGDKVYHVIYTVANCIQNAMKR